MQIYIDQYSITVGEGYYPLPMANIYFEDEDGVFPDWEFVEFASIVFKWWTEALISFMWGAKTVKLRFLDEQYYIHLTHEETGNGTLCKAYYGETRPSGNVLMREVDFDQLELVKSLAKAINTLLRHDEFQAQHPAEVAELQNAYSRLRQLLKK